MARKLIYGNDVVSFTPSTGVIIVNGHVPIQKLLLINNATINTTLYNFSDPNTTAVCTYNSSSNTTIIDLSVNTTLMSSSDDLQIYYEKEDLEIKPTRTYRDPVSKFRVSNPETLIDTDFEYGQQPTKWETVKLVNNIPTSYSSTFSENSISISSVWVSSGSNIMVVETSSPHGLPIGGVVEISGLADPQYEGTFIVKTSSTNSFSVKLSFKSNKFIILSTIYSVAYKGAFYTGSAIAAQEVETITGAASTVNITTPNIHGFRNRTKLYLKNSRATKRYSFNVPNSVVGVGTVFYRSEIKNTDFGNLPATEYYNNLRVITDDFIGSYEINVPSSSINLSNGVISFNYNNQLGSASSNLLEQGDVLTFYTFVENSPLQKAGPANITNFTPFRVSSINYGPTSASLTLSESYISSLNFVPTSSGTVQFGNHRFIRGFRITSFTSTNTITFNKEVPFTVNNQIIITSNITTSTYDGNTNSYLTKYNGQYNTGSYPYYKYTITSVSADKRSITVNTAGYGSFISRNVETAFPSNIWAASLVVDHPLSNCVYLPPSSGFSTSTYDDYQYFTYTNSNSNTIIPSLVNNGTYILRKTNTTNWYRIASSNNSADASNPWDNTFNLYFNVASLSNPSATPGSATNVLTVGIHTVNSSLSFKNSNTISLPNRGGFENNAIVVYNSTVSPIGNLSANSSYKVKTEDASIGSDKFRLSESTNFVKVYGFVYNATSNFATVYVYDTVDRVSGSPSASDGIISAGIANGNTIQISGSEYINPIKKSSINRSFKIISSPSVYTNTTKDSTSPVGTFKWIYSFNVSIPTDGTFNTQTSINIFVGQTYADTALTNARITSIINLDISNPSTNGEHVLTQNIDGAIDDIYDIVNASDTQFQFNTELEIPKVTKNIDNFGGSLGSSVNLNSTSFFSVTNNNTPSLTVSIGSQNFTFTWRSVSSVTNYTAPFAVEFRFSGDLMYYFNAGITEDLTSTNLNYTNGYTWYRDTYSQSRIGTINATSDYTISSSGSSVLDIFKIEYGTDGFVRWYYNGSQVASKNIGTGKTFKIFVSRLDYRFNNSDSANINNLKVSSVGSAFIPGVTNYLKIATHNFADGTEVKYNTTGAQPILPLANDGIYYVRVLDGDYIGLTSSFQTAIDRSQPTIGFTTSGTSNASNTLITDSVKGFLNGNGTVAISTNTSLVTGNNTNFLTDFTNGDMFRVYKLGIGTPGQYFESKITSIKSDKVLKIETIPSFSDNGANYFKQTALYAVSDGKITHRPFDGGVAIFSGLVPNTKVIRQTRKYFRYQSGKGIQVSMAINFNPTNDIDILSKVGIGATSVYNIKSKFPHKLSSQSVNTNQKIILSSVVGSASTFFNREASEIGFPITSISDDFNFTVDIGNNVNANDISGFPKYTVKNWKDSALRAGLFDDQNGFFYEYNGDTLYAVRRSSTQQISGQFEVQRNSYLVSGSNSILTRQLYPNDNIVIRGQTYKVISILNDSSMYIQPSYRGNSSTNVVISKTIDTKVPQSDWNLDKMDGTGESGYDIDINKIQMIYMDYSWYGAGSIRFGLKDQLGEVKYCHEFIHNNDFTESYFRTGNLPARYEVETFDDPLYSPALSHWGVSVIMDGRFDDDKAYLFTADSNALTFSGDGGSASFNGRVTQGSTTMTDISSSEYQSLVVGQTILPTSTYASYIDTDTKINAINIDQTGNRFGSTPTYKITMSKPALLGNNTQIDVNAVSGNSNDIQNFIPLVSIRLAPSVDNSTIGNLGFRDIINRMQLTLKSAGVLTTHDCEVRLVLNGKLSDESFIGVTSPSLSQVYKHQVGDKITEGISVFSFRAQGGTSITTNGRKSSNTTNVSLDELALLGNSILGGDGTFPDGPDVLTLAIKPIEPSTINGGSPLVASARITWTEAQA